MQIISSGDNLCEMSIPVVVVVVVFSSQKTGFDISCKLSTMETFCMKCQILFSGKNKKNIIILLTAELTQRVISRQFYMWSFHMKFMTTNVR